MDKSNGSSTMQKHSGVQMMYFYVFTTFKSEIESGSYYEKHIKSYILIHC